MKRQEFSAKGHLPWCSLESLILNPELALEQKCGEAPWPSVRGGKRDKDPGGSSPNLSKKLSEGRGQKSYSSQAPKTEILSHLLEKWDPCVDWKLGRTEQDRTTEIRSFRVLPWAEGVRGRGRRNKVLRSSPRPLSRLPAWPPHSSQRQRLPDFYAWSSLGCPGPARALCTKGSPRTLASSISPVVTFCRRTSRPTRPI